MDKQMGMQDGINGATFAIIYSDTEAAIAFDSVEQETIVISISEYRHIGRYKLSEIVPLLNVLIVPLQYVQMHGERTETVVGFGSLVGCQNMNLDENRKSHQLVLENGSHLAIAR
jgi:hypothetical protein